MTVRASILSSALVSLSLFLSAPRAEANKKPPVDLLHETVTDLARTMPLDGSGIYTVPSENDLREWAQILSLFRARAYDSCQTLLRKYSYSLSQLKDPMTKSVYDVIREDIPVRRGWGTYIFNRNHAKRVIIQVNHPIDDAGVLSLSTQLFRRTSAEWLLIAGTSRNAVPGRFSSDIGRLKRSVFQRWHEMLSDLTHVSLSLHGFNEKSYPNPIRSSDIIVSNGKTTDEQWGISQISLAFRDTMRAAGFFCSLAMYDSGLARLSGGWNPQGTFSNDSVGFGHWLYIELSERIRSQLSHYPELLSGFDRALDLTGKKVSQQVNRAFGLVSPRVLKLDSLQRLFFPPMNGEPYRIVAFSTRKLQPQLDSANLRMGSWLDLRSSRRGAASVVRLGSEQSSEDSTPPSGDDSRSVVARLIEARRSMLSSIVKLAKNTSSDSTTNGEDDPRIEEPMQVHRIPLQAVLVSTITQRSVSAMMPAVYRWEGIIAPNFNPQVPTFQMSNSDQMAEDRSGLPKFLIPLMSSSYRGGKSRFIGVQMTDILVNEIARLVVENQVKENDVGLLAEQSERGDYFLRVFPAGQASK